MRSSIKRPGVVAVFGLLFALNCPSELLAQWRTSFDSPGAAEQLRLGVTAYHMGRYAESLLLFEKALAYAPAEPLILFWLGRAYYKSGYEATALRTWEPLLELPEAPPTLRAAVENLRSSRSLHDAAREIRYVETARFEGKIGTKEFFNRPSAVIPRPDGSLLVVAHGSNEMLRMDPNGVIVERQRGGMRGFDRPFGAVLLPDGTVFVSEFNGDRITRLAGGEASVFGAKGRGPGQFLGPQYAACDSDGYLYISDFGNARVAKYDTEGHFILAFGAKTEDFPGFQSPTGIAVVQRTIYVADSYRRAIYRFDESGNYLGELAGGLLAAPEGLSPWQGGEALLIADTRRVLSLDLSTERLVELYRAPSKNARIIDAAADYNGNVVISDFDASSVSILSEAPSIAAGYTVEIERVESTSFPTVIFEVSVRDRRGLPVVGLGSRNFYVSERVKKTTMGEELGKPVTRIEESLVPATGVEFLGSGSASMERRVMLLGERSPRMTDYAEGLRSVLEEFSSSLGPDSALGLALAGPAPTLVAPARAAPDLKAMTRALLEDSSAEGRFDLGLRLAATSLLPSGVRDAVVYIGTGQVDESSFAGTTLSEIGALFVNNGVKFYAVLLADESPSPSLEYLAQRTGGSIYSASRPRGLGDLVAQLKSSASGRYRLRFTSAADAGFGNNVLSIAVEAYLYKKSGRDELEYYAPLK